VLADALGPLTTLAAVLVGGLLTHRVQSTSWRRDRRAEAYAAVIAAITDLDQRLLRQPLLEAIDIDDMTRRLIEPLRQATGLSHLYAGERVDWHLRDVVQAAYRLDGEDSERTAWHRAAGHLQQAMRDELHGRRRLRRYWVHRRHEH